MGFTIEVRYHRHPLGLMAGEEPHVMHLLPVLLTFICIGLLAYCFAG